MTLGFPAVGAALLLWSAARVRRWFWYRRSVLRLERTPVEIGGRIQGGILVPRRLEPLDGFQVSLTCSRRVRDADGDTDETVLWQDRVCVPGAASSYPEVRTRIPVSIPIPEDCEPWDDETPDRQVVWQLRVTAKIPGAPRLNQVFDAPVFRTRPEDRTGAARLFQTAFFVLRRKSFHQPDRMCGLNLPPGAPYSSSRRREDGRVSSRL